MKPQSPAPATSGHSLLQLVSDHALENLLPIMALRPSKLLLVRSADKSAESAVANLRAVVPVLAQDPAFNGYQPKIIDLPLSSTTPDIAETRDLIARELIANPGTMVNFTGGTKLMSIGAHLAASVFGRASFTFDHEQMRFVDAHTGRHERWPELGSLSKHFTPRLLLAIQGRSLDDYRHEPASDPLRAFGLKAYELRNQHSAAIEAFIKNLRAQFQTQNGRLPQEPEELKTLLAKPLPAGGDPIRFLLTATTNAGLTKSDSQGWKLSAAPERRAIERSLHLLSSGWLELAVLDCLQRNPRYQLPMWSFEHVKQSGNDSNDADILCVDTRSNSLRLICCRVALTRSPAEHLEGLAARARKLGGAACTFVIYKPAQGQEPLIRSEARRLGIDAAIEADEIVKAFSPHAG